MMKQSIKRMVLTGAAVTVMMSFAAPAMAEDRAQSANAQFGFDVCDIAPLLCDPPPVKPTDPVVDPVADPPLDPVTPDPVTPDPVTPDPVTNPPDNQGPVNDKPQTGNISGGSTSSASETLDSGGTLVSSILPTTLTSTIGEAGNSVKKNLPAPVAKSLPNTGGGWSFLVFAAAALIAGSFVIKSIVRRATTSDTRTAQ
jgi:hypothetical protein